MAYNLISADGHVDLRFLPGDVFVANAPAKWKDQVPRIVETDQDRAGMPRGGTCYRCLEASWRASRRCPGMSKHVDRMYEVDFTTARPTLLPRSYGSKIRISTVLTPRLCMGCSVCTGCCRIASSSPWSTSSTTTTWHSLQSQPGASAGAGVHSQ